MKSAAKRMSDSAPESFKLAICGGKDVVPLLRAALQPSDEIWLEVDGALGADMRLTEALRLRCIAVDSFSLAGPETSANVMRDVDAVILHLPTEEHASLVWNLLSRLRDNEALIHPEHLAEVAIVVHGPETCAAEADAFVAEQYHLEVKERYLPWLCAPSYWVDVAEDVAPRELLKRAIGPTSWLQRRGLFSDGRGREIAEAMGYPPRAGDLLSE